MADQPFPELPPLPANPYASPAAAGVPTKTSGLAVASLVLGILSCPLSVLTGIPGLVCGIMGLNRIARSERTPGGPRLTGQGLAIAGIILSSLTTLVLPVMVGLMLPAVQAAREAARRSVCSNNLRSAAFGMLLHESERGILPAAITAADGTPLLSWRVAILPFVDEQALYDEFHLDEPWDSPHNRTLIPRMPQCYACPSTPLDEGQTRYLLLDGPGAAFARRNLRPGDDAAPPVVGVRLADLEDDADETIMIVEAPVDRAVAWTKPEEFSVSPAEAAERDTGGAGHGGRIRHAAYADGHVEALMPDAHVTRGAGP